MECILDRKLLSLSHPIQQVTLCRFLSRGYSASSYSFTNVRSGSAICANVTVVSDTVLTCLSPPGFGLKTVTVSIDDGTSRFGTLSAAVTFATFFFGGASGFSSSDKGFIGVSPILGSGADYVSSVQSGSCASSRFDGVWTGYCEHAFSCTSASCANVACSSGNTSCRQDFRCGSLLSHFFDTDQFAVSLSTRQQA